MVFAAPARADDDASAMIAPLNATLGDGWTGNLGVNLSGAVYAAHQDGGVDRQGVQAFAIFAPSLTKTLSDGWEIGAKGSILAYHDHLSGDNFGNDVFELGYAYAQTPYGRVEIGEQTGAAYSLAVSAPLVDGPPAINDANVVFFKDPATGLAFNGIFNLRTGIFTSANDTKISYISPRLSGLQFGISYTPYKAKGVLPFADKDHDVPDRVTNFLEGNVNYSAQLGSWNMQASTSAAVAHDAKPTPEHDDVWDWGAGIETDTTLDDAKISFGVAYRISNAYTFNVQQASRHGETSNIDFGTVYNLGAWSAGVEYETGMADGVLGMPGLKENGWNPSISYAVNSNIQLTAGWQYMHFRESTGTFYNGNPSIGMNAFYLHTNITI